MYQDCTHETRILAWLTPDLRNAQSIHKWAPGYLGTQRKSKSSVKTQLQIWVSVRPDLLIAEPDYHIVGIRFLVCHVINPSFNLETPWSIRIYQWCPKEKQFCNCQKRDGMVRRTWNQLCKLWYVSHISICNVTVWKLELFFCQYRKSQRLCVVSYEKTAVPCSNYLRHAPSNLPDSFPTKPVAQEPSVLCLIWYLQISYNGGMHVTI